MSSLSVNSRRISQMMVLLFVVLFSVGVISLSAQEESPTVDEAPAVDEYGVPLAPRIISQEETPAGLHTVTEIPIRMDTFATSGIPEGQPPIAFTNHGGRTDLRLGFNTPLGFGAERIYLWFDVASAGIPSNATINWARIQMWASDGAGDMGFEARHLNSSWGEFSLTWMSNRPQWGGSLGTGVISAGSGEKSGDATNLVRDWITGAHPNNGIIIIGNEGQAAPFERVFHSREAANGLQPRLIVDWVVAVDTVPPESTISQLPPISRGEFTVSWSGQDFGNPATGIAFWDVDFSTNGSTWAQWLRGTTNQSATWQSGNDGTNYFFRVRAVDNAGNVESWTRSSAQQTNTVIDSIPPTVALSPMPQFTYDPGFPITWNGGDNRSGVRQYEVQFNVNGGPWQFGQVFQLSDGTHTRFVTGAVNGETYGFRVRATDNVGNTGPWSNETSTSVFLTPPYPSATVLPFIPPNHVAGPPGISNSETFRVFWDLVSAPGTTLLNETRVWYSCDGGPWTQWGTVQSGTFADFDAAVDNVGCDNGRDVHIYRFEASGRARYPDNSIRDEAQNQQAEASVILDVGGNVIVRAYLPIVGNGSAPVGMNNVEPGTMLNFTLEE